MPSQLIDSIFTLYLKLPGRYHYCRHLLDRSLAILDTNINRRPGGVFYSGPVTYKVVNTGAKPVHNLIVELKKVS